MLKNQDMKSVNQMAAQIKLTEIWQATHVENFAIKVKHQITSENARVTRGDESNKLAEKRKTTLNMNTCIGDATSLWNYVMPEIRNAPTLGKAKKEINIFVSNLPQ